MTRAVLAVLAAFLLSACGGAGGDPAGGGAGEADLAGRFGGDAALEGGCAWLDPVDGGERVQPVWPAGYEVRFDPLRLIGPDGETVAEEGDTVLVDGERAEDAVTVCQVGPVFEVTEVRGTR